MNTRLFLSLLIAAPTATTAGAQAPLKWADLSREEKSFVERAAGQANPCETTECRDQIFLKIAQVVTLRRSAGAQLLSDVTLRELKQSCDQHEDKLDTRNNRDFGDLIGRGAA
ncbi:MAG: hypothetical protein KatS3mg120_0885 [Erythrobacter sp.]|nr:MAG: hypothetical protein KatS3mg120_0885 [Erythrobacter sp.]